VRDVLIIALMQLRLSEGDRTLADRERVADVARRAAPLAPGKAKALLLLLDSKIVSALAAWAADARPNKKTLHQMRAFLLERIAQSGKLSRYAAEWAVDAWIRVLALESPSSSRESLNTSDSTIVAPTPPSRAQSDPKSSTNRTSRTYRVLISGVRRDRDPADVAEALAALFKVPVERVQPLLGQSGMTLKEGVDLATAARYQAALERAGCNSVVAPEHTGPAISALESSRASTPQAEVDTTTRDADVASNRPAQESEALDKRQLSIAELVRSWSLVDWLGAGFIVVGIFVIASKMTSPSSEAQGSDSRSGSQERLVEEIWRGYQKAPGNRGTGIKEINVRGRLIETGTVPASAMATSAIGRLPAYLACYDYVMVISGMGDTEANMCVFYIDNPSRGTYSVAWRGRQHLEQLRGIMRSSEFSAD